MAENLLLIRLDYVRLCSAMLCCDKDYQSVLINATKMGTYKVEEILTVKEVAEYLKVSRTTVWRWCNQKKLPAFKVGRGWRVRQCEVEKLIGQNGMGTGESKVSGQDENSQ